MKQLDRILQSDMAESIDFREIMEELRTKILERETEVLKQKLVK
jgi:hypothetical protein